jgi:hypothetical protein
MRRLAPPSPIAAASIKEMEGEIEDEEVWSLHDSVHRCALCAAVVQF